MNASLVSNLERQFLSLLAKGGSQSEEADWPVSSAAWKSRKKEAGGKGEAAHYMLSISKLLTFFAPYSTLVCVSGIIHAIRGDLVVGGGGGINFALLRQLAVVSCALRSCDGNGFKDCGSVEGRSSRLEGAWEGLEIIRQRFETREGVWHGREIDRNMLSSPEVDEIVRTSSCSLIEAFVLLNPSANPAVRNSKCGSFITMFGCSSAFLSGVLLVLLVEALVIMFLVLRSLEKNPRPSTPHTSSVNVEIPENSLLFSLQGGVWIAALPAGDVKKMYTKREKALKEKAAKEQKNEQENGNKESKSKKDVLKDYIHVAPVWRYARLQGRILHLSCKGVKESILLEGCEVVSVSGSAQPGRKWAKKYPIKLHNGSRHIYGGSHDCLLYLETGWEKEAWCEVLRASANWESDTDDWYFKLKKEYQEYLFRVENQFPFLRGLPQASLPRPEEKGKIPKAEIAANTKKRLLWKKLTRRSLKGNKGKNSGEGEDAKRASSDTEDGSSKNGSIANSVGDLGRIGSLEDFSVRDIVGPDETTQNAARAASYNDLATATVDRDTTSVPQIESLERSLLCVNMLFSRIFFDLYHSSAVVARIRALLQRQLSKVPTPSYIGNINCTHLDLGNSPPLAQNFHLLPPESDGGWGVEADVEYFGGAILTIETRIDVRDSNQREKVVVQGIEQTLAGAATEDLLNKGLENLKTDCHIAVDDGSSTADQRNGGGTSTSSRPADVRGSEEGSRKGWMQSSITNVKAMMSRVAEQVSQMHEACSVRKDSMTSQKAEDLSMSCLSPFSLARILSCYARVVHGIHAPTGEVPLALTIRVAQLKGTLQVRVKPPPSDRVWFSFTEMPVLELLPEPCIGDHKINSGPLGAFIVNQIKILLRDSMVAPQCEDISYSWMISEAGNWVPRDVIPLAFVPDREQYDQSTQKERRESLLRREASVDNTRLDGSGVGASNSLPGIPFQYSQEDLGSPPVSPSRVSLASKSLPIKPWTRDPLDDLTRPLIETEELVLEESQRESDAVIVNLMEAPPVITYAQAQTHTTSSSDSDSGPRLPEEMDLLQTQAQVRASRRGKVLTFGKRMGTKIEEKRKSALEKWRDRSQQQG